MPDILVRRKRNKARKVRRELRTTGGSPGAATWLPALKERRKIARAG